MPTPTDPPDPPALPPDPPPDDVRAAEQADEAKTADDAPAPVHDEREREVIVRDATGLDPYEGDRHGHDAPALGTPPEELPDPRAAALDAVKPADPRAEPIDAIKPG